MKEKSDITDLFRSRLSDAKMPVREGFWEKLNESMCQCDNVPMRKVSIGTFAHLHICTLKNWHICTLKNWHIKSVAAAAAVVLMLGAASAAFWYFSPKEEIKEAFTQADQLAVDEGQWHTDEKDNTDGHRLSARINPNQCHQSAISSAKISNSSASSIEEETDDDETMSVHVSITITERVVGNDYYGDLLSTGNGGYRPASDTHRQTATDETETTQPASQPKPRNWALKVGMETALPKGDCDAPFTAAVSVERQLGKRFSVEAGLRYNCLNGTPTLHALEVPVRVNLLLASSRKVDLYALAGGAAEKCVAGADDNGFSAEPVQLSVAAGLGVRYKLSDRLSLFAEPTVSRHFDTDSKTRSLRTERATNLNLLCGLRMTY